MSPSPPGEGTRRAVARVAGNTAVRAAAELIGKFATLVLIAVLARSEGPAALGMFVFALAWVELASILIDMGFDRHAMRLIARDKDRLGEVFYNVLALKLRRAVPVVAASWLLLYLLGHDGDTRTAVYLLTGAYLVETVRWTLFAAFTAHERGDLAGLVLVAQRLSAGGLGLAALLLGFGVVGVAAAYLIAAGVAAGLGLRLLARHIGLPRWQLPRDARRRLEKGSLPFAAQEILSVGMSRIDAVLLAIFATQAVVGLYGAAYRMLEATLFISTALLGAFSAMFTYLDETTEPTVNAVFARSLKLSLVLLMPLAVPLAVAPEPILVLIFGSEFATGAEALRILAPVVLLLGTVMLCGSLIASRLDPRLLLRCFAIAFTINVAGNVALIPALGATGAAVAMLVTELALAVIMLRIAIRAVGRVSVPATAGAAVVAGAGMAVVVALLQGVLPAALVAGAVTYVLLLGFVDRRLAPEDFEHLKDLVLARLRGRRGEAPRSAAPVVDSG